MKKTTLVFLLFLASLAVTVSGDSLTALFTVSLSHDQKSVSGETVTRDAGRFRSSTGFDYGTSTAAAEVSAGYSVRGQVSSGTRLSYDLQSLTDKLGNAVVFNRIKAASIKNLDATTSLIIGSGTTPWAAGMATPTTITLPPLGVWCVSAPYAGYDASLTARVIYLESSDAIASFDLAIVGVE